MAIQQSLAVYERNRTAHGLEETSAPDWHDYDGKYHAIIRYSPEDRDKPLGILGKLLEGLTNDIRRWETS